jgi:hypothetical protein
MTFKEWCLLRYGIVYFEEARIVANVFLPASSPSSSIQLDDLVLAHEGHVTHHDNRPGLVLSRHNYNLLIKKLRSDYNEAKLTNPDIISFKEWKNAYFARLGINVNQKTEHRYLPKINVTLSDSEKAMAFCHHFASFNPEMSKSSLTEYNTVVMPSYFLEEMYNLYYQAPSTEMHKITDIASMRMHKSAMEKLLYDIHHRRLYRSIDYASELALDYGNSKRNLHLKGSEACDAYAISLKVFAELNRDNLTSDQYQSLLYASSMLAAYGSNGELMPSLKKDEDFREHSLADIYFGCIKDYSIDCSQGRPLIIDLPDPFNRFIQEDIDTNTYEVLYGSHNPEAEEGASSRADRFLPNDEMQSDKSEIILSSGGSIGHFAIVRIIKVGMLANHQPADADQVPHHYAYFKVENNVGARCHHPDITTNTCLATYVTQLEPFTKDSEGNFVRSDIDPYTHPTEYQAAMADTLQALIKVERQLNLYRTANKDQISDVRTSPSSSDEADEWSRLDRTKILLSGHAYHEPVSYFVCDLNDPSKLHRFTIQNQRGFMQQSGSCTVASCKNFVQNIMGHELTMLHTSFMQRYGVEFYLATLESKIHALDNQINALEPLQITVRNEYALPWLNKFTAYLYERGLAIDLRGLVVMLSDKQGESVISISDPALKNEWLNFFSFYQQQQAASYATSQRQMGFFERPQQSPMFNLLQRLNLLFPDSIVMATLTKDSDAPSQNTIKLTCASPFHTQKLLEIIGTLTTATPGVKGSGSHHIMLDEHLFSILCNKVSLDYKNAIQSLPQEETSTEKHSPKPYNH